MRAVAWNMLKPENLTDRLNEDQVTRRLIVSVAKNLDREAFGKLFDAFAPRLKSFMIRKGASPEVAEDLVQETMISVWRKAGLYDPTKGSALTWIFTIARNLRIDRIRKESSMPLSELGDYDAPSDDMANDDVLSRKQESQRVAQALAEILADPEAARKRAASGPAYINATRSYRMLATTVAEQYRLIADKGGI